MTTGRRCPNAALQGSQYCGLPQHQALAKFSTNQVAVLGTLSDEEVASVASGDAGDDAVKTLVEKAESQFDESAEAAEPEAEESEEASSDEAEEEKPGEEASPEEETDADEEPEPEHTVEPAQETATEDGGAPEAEEEQEQETVTASEEQASE
jgi:transcription termination/antitermination protein NusA